MTSNYIEKLTKVNGNDADLWRNYGFTIKYAGSYGKAKKIFTKPLRGLYINNFNVSSSASISETALGSTVNDATKSAVDTVVTKAGNLVEKVPIVGNILKKGVEKAQDAAKAALGQSIAETSKVYQNGNGRPVISISTFFVPGLFGFDSYEYLEKFAAYATLPRNVLGNDAGLFIANSQYLYDPSLRELASITKFKKELFSIKINNIATIPGGLFITDFKRDYSLEKDENGQPIFCQVDITLEYYREVFADEYVKFFSKLKG